MRRASKVDANQGRVVDALRAIGCSVQSLASIGDGCPDLLVGYRGRNVIAELKDGSKPPSARQLRPEQVEWHREWRGQAVRVWLSAEQAVHEMQNLG